MKKLLAVITLLACMALSSSASFGEELKLSLAVVDFQPELEANRMSVNVLKGVSIDTIIITATKGNNLTWSVTPSLLSGLTSLVNENKYVISGAPSAGTSGSHTFTITAKNAAGSASKEVTINVTGQNISDDLIDEDGTFRGTPESQLTSINELGQSVTETVTAFTNSAGELILSADVAITTASSDFVVTSGDLFSQVVSVDVTLSVLDADYDEYYYSMDIAGLPEWLSISGDIASSCDIDSESYHHEFTISGRPSSDDVITLTAGIKISGDYPVLAAFGSKDVRVSVKEPPAPAPDPDPDPDPDPERTLQALHAEIDGASEVETTQGTAASSTFSAVVTGDFGAGFEAIPAESYALTWSITPSDVTGISFADGTLSIGASVDVGTYEFTLVAEAVSSSISASANKSVKVIVSSHQDVSVDVAPVLEESVYSLSDRPGQEVTLTIRATEGTNLAWTVSGNLPEGLTGTSDGMTCTISGTLSLSDAGRAYRFTVTASNSAGSANADVTIRIQDIPPEVSGGTESLTIENGHEISPVTFTATGTNIAWSASGTLPNGLTGTSEADTFMIGGTPSGNSVNESFAYTVTASNSAGSSSRGITFTVKSSGSGTTSPDVPPDKPDEPDKPDNPDNPDNPDKPDEPDNPDTPDEPESHDVPSNPETIKEYKLKPGESINLIDGMTNLEILDLTEANTIRSLDLSGNTTIKQVILTGNDVIESLNLSGSAVEMIEARGCENLGEVIIEDCENLEYLDIGETETQSLTLSNCENLSVLICESCDLSILNIENCDSLADIDCRYNHLADFDASLFADLMRLECEHQTLLDFPARLSMNVYELFSHSSNGNVSSSAAAISRVKNLRAFDASGNELPLAYDESTGEIKFSSLPAKFTYDYDTGFNGVQMDVTVFVSEHETPARPNTVGPSGGCDAELTFASLMIVILFRRRRR